MARGQSAPPTANQPTPWPRAPRTPRAAPKGLCCICIQVQYFTERGYRCEVVTLPNCDGNGGGWGMDWDDLVDTLLVAVRAAVGTDGKVVLFTHDWGATLGYRIQQVCLASHGTAAAAVAERYDVDAWNWLCPVQRRRPPHERQGVPP